MTEAAFTSLSPSQRSWLDKISTGNLIAIEAAALVLVTGAWAVPQALRGLEPAPWAVAVSAALLLGLLATLFFSGGLLAVALHTFAQCIRMRVSLAFMVLLAAALAALPSMKALNPEGQTLADSIRTLLDYGTSVTALLLSVVTVLVASSVVSGDIQRKQIFMTATKPLARWQYVLGRWLGVVLLDALLLAVAMGTLYVIAQHLRSQPERGDTPEARADDRRAVETEIFTARGKAYPDPINIPFLISKRVETLKAGGVYEQTIESLLARTGGNPKLAEMVFLQELRKSVEGEQYSAPPGGWRFWTFSGIRAQGGQVNLPGTVVGAEERALQVKFHVDPGQASRMIYETPVHVENVDGRVFEAAGDLLILQFDTDENFRRLDIPHLLGREVVITVDPSVQLAYKASSSNELPDGLITSMWFFRNRITNEAHLQSRRDPVNRQDTLTVTSRVVDPNGNVEVQFNNLTRASITISPDNIYILFNEGGFEWNYLRATLLMLLQLAFLAALGVMAGTFLSFPVAVLMCMVLLLVALGRPFIAEAVKISSIFAPGVDFLTRAGYLSMGLMTLLLPDFASTWPSTMLVDGLHIPWTQLGETACLTVAIRTLAALGIGCLIFRRKELARVQV